MIDCHFCKLNVTLNCIRRKLRYASDHRYSLLEFVNKIILSMFLSKRRKTNSKLEKITRKIEQSTVYLFFFCSSYKSRTSLFIEKQKNELCAIRVCSCIKLVFREICINIYSQRVKSTKMYERKKKKSREEPVLFSH